MPASNNSPVRQKLSALEFIVCQHSLFFAAGGQSFFYVHLLKPYLPVWAATPFFMVPWAVIFIIFYPSHSLFSPRETRRYWLNAASWYALFTILAEIIWFAGYMPPLKAVHPPLAMAVIQVLMNLGWLSFLPIIHDCRRNPRLWK
jgi:hypothetical protein